MAIREQGGSREAVSIFSLSFLDVFACCLGALILILMMVVNQVARAFDPEAMQKQLEAVQKENAADKANLQEYAVAQSSAKKWDQEKPQITNEINELTAEIRRNEAAIAQFGGVTTETVVEARQVVAQAKSRLDNTKKNAGALWFGSGRTDKRPRFLEVVSGEVIDVKNSRAKLSPGQVSWFLREELTPGEYPVFIIHPEGVTLWEGLEDVVERTGVDYGFEPFTSAWSKILGGTTP